MLIWMVFSALARAEAASNYDAYFLPAVIEESSADATRAKLLALSKDEAKALVKSAGPWLSEPGEKRERVVQTFSVLRENPNFDSSLAAQMLTALELDSGGASRGSVLGQPTARTAIGEKRLILLLYAKAGRFDAERVKSEFKFINDKSKSSTERTGRLGALTDAMAESGVRPTPAQLESLLTSDAFAIRLHAVDWFRLVPFSSEADRIRFLKKALALSPLQARTRAREACADDASASVRKACADVKYKPGAP